MKQRSFFGIIECLRKKQLRLRRTVRQLQIDRNAMHWDWIQVGGRLLDLEQIVRNQAALIQRLRKVVGDDVPEKTAEKETGRKGQEAPEGVGA